MDNSDLPALALFYDGQVPDGLGDDGLPIYRNVLMIKIARPPLTSIDRPATDEDMSYFEEQYRVYERQAKGRTVQAEGYPLTMWPACSKAEVDMLHAREIYTVQDLAKLAARKTEKFIPELREIAERSLRFIKLSADRGALEAQLHDLRSELEALKEEKADMLTTINSQRAQIDALRVRA